MKCDITTFIALVLNYICFANEIHILRCSDGFIYQAFKPATKLIITARGID